MGLCLGRKTDEAILIFIPGRKAPVRISVKAIHRSIVKLTLEADTDITFFREEMFNGAPNAVRVIDSLDGEDSGVPSTTRRSLEGRISGRQEDDIDQRAVESDVPY